MSQLQWVRELSPGTVGRQSIAGHHFHTRSHSHSHLCQFSFVSRRKPEKPEEAQPNTTRLYSLTALVFLIDSGDALKGMLSLQERGRSIWSPSWIFWRFLVVLSAADICQKPSQLLSAWPVEWEEIWPEFRETLPHSEIPAAVHGMWAKGLVTRSFQPYHRETKERENKQLAEGG